MINFASMKNVFYLASLLLVGMTFTCRLDAQDYSEYYRFAEEAKEKSMIYRGRQAPIYNFPADGTFYWADTKFINGDVLYNGKLYRDVLLNLDANLGILLVKQSEGMPAVSVDNNYVSWFSIDGDFFLNREGELGYWQVIHEGEEAQLYKKITKVLHRNSSGSLANATDIETYGEPRYVFRFQERTEYQLLKDGETITIKQSKNILKKLISKFPEHKKELKQFAHSQGLSSSEFDTSAAAILNHIENEK